MGDRRYGQRGYREYEKERQGKPKEPARSGAPAMPQTRTVSRCADCGTPLPPLTDSLGQCPKCRSELHSCRQCAHFDPGQHYECTFFSLHVTVERDASSGSARPEDARRAFDNLFKKK